MACDVCVLGSLNMDLVVRAPRLPAAGETVLGGPFQRHPGGKGANQAVAAARAGAGVVLIGAVGGDEHGAELVRVVAAEGIDVSRVARRAGTATGIALITVSNDGENTIVVAPGANESVSGVELARDGGMPDATWLVAQLEVPLDVVVQACREASSRGMRTLLNAAPARPAPRELLAALDVLVVNRDEARQLAGEQRDELALARELARRGPRTVVVTLGAAGALLVTGDDVLRQQAFAVEALDSTGAGDAFVGHFVASLARGDPARVALRRACAAGALAATVRGAIASLPTRAAVESLLATAGS